MAPRKTRSRERIGIGFDTDLRRREPSKELRSLIIVTNGECAERKYFTRLKSLPWVTATTVRIVFQPGDPRAVVKRAGAMLADGGCDEAWAVCDVDDYASQLDEVTRLADRVRVGLALSNPCFEVWLIFHHGACGRYFENADQVQKHLKKLDPRWDKLRPEFTTYLDRVTVAEAHARRSGDPVADNPSTAVWTLIESMRKDHSPQKSPPPDDCDQE